MSSNVIFFGWNRSIPGHESVSAAHFQEFVEYLAGLQQQGTIESFEAVLLNPHGGDMNGFFLIRGENANLDALMASDQWGAHLTRGSLHLEGLGAVRGATGDLVMERMAMWRELVSS